MRQVQVTGGDLYHIALQYLGDGTQWNRIAEANDLLDPVVTGTVTLNIPSVDPGATGGVLVI